MRWSQRVVDLADGDPSRGNFIFGSPLTLALTTRAFGRYCLGRPGWHDDLLQGLAMAHSVDPLTCAAAVTYAYGAGIPTGVLRSDNSAIREIEDVLHSAKRPGGAVDADGDLLTHDFRVVDSPRNHLEPQSVCPIHEGLAVDQAVVRQDNIGTHHHRADACGPARQRR
jgi:hypothetical protein